MSHVVVIGSFNVDHVWRSATLPASGQTLHGQYSTGPGGKGFNQAVACARHAVHTTFVCALGADYGADLCTTLASDCNLNLQAHRSALPTGTAGIWLDAHGNNSIVIGAGANGDLTAAVVSAQASFFENAHVVLAQLETPIDAVSEALRIAGASGAIRILNPAPANAVCPAELLQLCDILTPNESETAALLNDGTRADALAAMSDKDLHALCRRLLPHGTVVITMGAQGCFVSHADANLRDDDAPYYRISAPQVDVVDTTGAGDALNGALAAALSHQHWNFAQQIQWAVNYASAATEHQGAALAMPAASGFRLDDAD